MKISPLAILLLLGVLIPAQSQERNSSGVATTVPVGMTAERLSPGPNLFGVRLHHRSLFDGKIGEIGENFVTVEVGPNKNAAFENLRPGVTYVLEIRSGVQDGAIQEITDWQDGRLITPENLADAGVRAGDKVTLREAATLASVFGTVHSPLKKGDKASEADLVVIPAAGQLAGRSFFVDSAGVWRDASTGKNAGGEPLVYPDAVIVLTRDARVRTVVVAGEMKTGPQRSVIHKGINLVATPGPAGNVLQKLGLEEDLIGADGRNDADEVWIKSSTNPGGFDVYHLGADKQWLAADRKPVEAPVSVGSALIIFRKGETTQICLRDS